jgi:hypothetical protein
MSECFSSPFNNKIIYIIKNICFSGWGRVGWVFYFTDGCWECVFVVLGCGAGAGRLG